MQTHSIRLKFCSVVWNYLHIMYTCRPSSLYLFLATFEVAKDVFSLQNKLHLKICQKCIDLMEESKLNCEDTSSSV
jgi:hypothetical protein